MTRIRVATIAAWTAAGLWSAWAVVRLLGLESGFPSVQLLAFTPFVALTSVLPIALAMWLGRRRAAALAAVAAALLAIAVLPRSFGGPTEPEGEAGATLRVLAANMKLGKGDPAELAALAEDLDVDVLAVVELTQELVQELDGAGLRELLPERALAAESGSFGAGLYARAGLGRGSIVVLAGGFPLFSAPLAIPGAPSLGIYAVHTQPPTRNGGGEWDDDLRALPDAGSSPPLRILMGDFNATLDHGEFRAVLDRGYDDAADTLGEGLDPTWPEHRRFPPLVTIDHVLADERIGIRDYSTHEIAGSDHRAVFAELLLPAE
jgi:endonuclease/exonuclease/phosphatase (EEP) superfamily protein YafD